MGIPIVSGILSLVDTAGKLFGNWQEKKLIQAQGKVDIEKAKVDGAIKRVQTQVDADVQYDQTAAEGMAGSWKDEIFVITWLAILVGCFLPWTQAYVKEGFVFLSENCPWWFQYSLLGMVAASFGLKGWKMWAKPPK